MSKIEGILYLLLSLFGSVFTCTNFLLSPGATSDHSTMITYAADAHVLYGVLYFYPAGDHAPGAKRQIYEWITNKYLGEIPEAAHTYKVIGNMNENQVAIGETTYGGIKPLSEEHFPGSIMDYGSLIYISLQRSRSAREAVTIFTTLAETYGYVSEGESLSISDSEEAWHLEIIGRGSFEKGILWVAKRVPDGYVGGHANQPRITTYDLSDTDNVMGSADTVVFAKAHGFYTGEDVDFSFSDTFAPMTPGHARTCEARVWAFFRHVTDGMDAYLDYVQGYNLTNRMPLFVKPTKLVSRKEVMSYMRDHFEDTWFDFRGDVGAQAFHLPYRWRPLDWEFGDPKQLYGNMRSTSTQQTAWHYVAQSRPSLPDPIGGLFWFGLDDAALSVHVPLYMSLQSIPWEYALGNGAMMDFNFQSAFWVFNLVANFAYMRYDILQPVILSKVLQLEDQYEQEVLLKDTEAASIYATNPEQAIEYLSAYSLETAEKLVTDWFAYYGELFATYMDGFHKVPVPGDPHNPKVETPGYGAEWYDRIVAATGDHYLLKTSANLRGINKVSDVDLERFMKLVRKGKI